MGGTRSIVGARRTGVVVPFTDALAWMVTSFLNTPSSRRQLVSKSHGSFGTDMRRLAIHQRDVTLIPLQAAGCRVSSALTFSTQMLVNY